MVSGYAVTGDDTRKAGERINNLKNMFNIREGWTSTDDDLPPSVLAESDVGDGLTRHRLQELIVAYYQIRGWDEQGMIPAGKVAEIGLVDLFNLESSGLQPRSLL